MHFDDRLATVLRHRAAGERAGKTQFRQLIDLLGERPQAGDPALKFSYFGFAPGPVSPAAFALAAAAAVWVRKASRSEGREKEPPPSSERTVSRIG